MTQAEFEDRLAVRICARALAVLHPELTKIEREIFAHISQYAWQRLEAVKLLNSWFPGGGK